VALALITSYLWFFLMKGKAPVSAWLIPGFVFVLVSAGILTDFMGREKNPRRGFVRLAVMLGTFSPIVVMAIMR